MRARFFDLASELGELGAWVRLHYVYPYPHVDEVIALMAEGKVLPYLDIPFQHASPTVLKAMRRPAQPGEDARAHPRAGARSARTSRSARPSSSASPARRRRISSSCSTGCKEAKLDRVGCFKYEPVARRAGQRPRRAGARRRSRKSAGTASWRRSRRSAPRSSQAKVGKRLPVIVDEAGPTVAKGRSKCDAPEIDGTVHVASRRPLRAGDIVTVKIERADAYDLHGVAV